MTGATNWGGQFMARIIKDLRRGYNAKVQPSLAKWVAQQRLTLKLPADADTTPLTAEASHRRFYRQHTPGSQTLIVMDSPPALERNQAFIDLASVFRQAGLPVPQILATEPDQGFMIMTDVGDRDLYAAYGDGEQDEALAVALQTLLQLQTVRSEHIPEYTAQRLHDELQIFREWFIERTLEEVFPAATLMPMFEQLVTAADTQPKVCVHRDYHCRNLLFDRNHELGIVDFQDALHGPITYDLASLLRDCYYELPEATVTRWREWFRTRALPDLPPETFARQMDWMALQRQLKAVGIFVRLQLRDGKSSHLAHVLPTLAQIERLAGGYAEMAPLSQWLGSQRPLIAQRLKALQSGSLPS